MGYEIRSYKNNKFAAKAAPIETGARDEEKIYVCRHEGWLACINGALPSSA